jgi:1-acyl-sn-glycerol-3-phosphate acyltransferase
VSAGGATEVPDPVPARSFQEPTVRDLVVNALLWGVGVSFLVPYLGASTLLYQVMPSHRADFLGKFYCWAQLGLTFNRWRAVVHPDVDPGRPYIFAQNHTNHFDHVAMYNATPHFKQGLELETHFAYPFYGWFMKARGTIPVPKDRQGRTEAVREGIRREIEAGRSILAFPEGTRTVGGRLGPLRKGIFVIARDLGVPIVPTAVTGAFDMMRKGSLVIRPGNEITVYCDAPVEMAGVSDEDIPAKMEEVRRALAGRIDAYWADKVKSR